MTPSPDLSRLIEIMAALRTPATGCPWDLVQTFETIAPYTIEEAHEVADAIRRGDMIDLRDELGDLLLQVVYHARLAEEAGQFSVPDVVLAITTKMIRRHPHVFARTGLDASSSSDPEGAKHVWDTIKATEKAERAEARRAAGLPDDTSPSGLLGSIKPSLPGFLRALKLQEKAATVGFDWNDAQLVLDKIEEEVAEVREALGTGTGAAIEDEIGDLLFAAVNLARHAKVDPETCLQRASDKFARRFGFIERELGAEGRTLADAGLEEMEALWVKAKSAPSP